MGNPTLIWPSAYRRAPEKGNRTAKAGPMNIWSWVRPDLPLVCIAGCLSVGRLSLERPSSPPFYLRRGKEAKFDGEDAFN
jgi:hypothetical protein